MGDFIVSRVEVPRFRFHYVALSSAFSAIGWHEAELSAGQSSRVYLLGTEYKSFVQSLRALREKF